MLGFGQITALGTVVFTAVLLLRNLVALVRLLRERADYARKDQLKEWKAGWVPYASSVVTQVVAWLAGIGAVYILDFSDLGRSFAIGTLNIVTLSGWSKVMVGLMAASTLSTVNELKKAFDNTDSAKAPPLISNTETLKAIAHPVKQSATVKVKEQGSEGSDATVVIQVHADTVAVAGP